jgi:hypothetical protein
VFLYLRLRFATAVMAVAPITVVAVATVMLLTGLMMLMCVVLWCTSCKLKPPHCLVI